MLYHMDTTMGARDTLMDEVADNIRKAADKVDAVGRYDNAHINAAVKGLFDLRQTFTTRSGEPDYLGQSYPYRQAFGEILARAGLTGEARSRMGSSLRYHMGNHIREVLDDETRERLGLVKLSPRETSTQAHAKKARLWRNMGETGIEPITNPEEGVEALLGLANLLEQLSVDWSKATPQQQQVAKLATRRVRELALALPE
jgi:hypothetical protein